MRIRERICVILMFAASFALSAQSNDLALKSRNQTNVADVRQIVESSIAATQQHWRARLRYTYMEREVSRRRDSAGRLKSEDVDASRTFLVSGVPFEQLVERNGQPPSAEEDNKQQEKLDKLKRETPEQRAERLRRQEDENASLVREVPRPSISSWLVKKQLMGAGLCASSDAAPRLSSAGQVRQDVFQGRGQALGRQAGSRVDQG